MNDSLNRLALSLLPKRTLTALIASFARVPASRILIPWYIRHYKISVKDAAKPVSDYHSLLDFFCRALKSGARPIADAPVVSPVDGTVSECGRIEEGRLLQAKGCSYTLEALLGDATAATGFQQGMYLTLYLSPRDYHRIHMPMAGTVRSWRYVPGKLFPVNQYGVRLIPGLYTKNERMITEFSTILGNMAMVKVGATVVGSVQVRYADFSAKAFSKERRSAAHGSGGIRYAKGEEIGHFEFGSTVILLFEPGMIDSFCVREGQVVRMGDALVR